MSRRPNIGGRWKEADFDPAEPCSAAVRAAQTRLEAGDPRTLADYDRACAVAELAAVRNLVALESGRFRERP